MSSWLPIANLADLKEGCGKTVEAKGRLIAIFLDEGVPRAIDDTCPHMGASLAEGAVCNGVVTCPWHGWRFRIKDGRWADVPSSTGGVGSYNVKVEGPTVFLEVNW